MFDDLKHVQPVSANPSLHESQQLFFQLHLSRPRHLRYEMQQQPLPRVMAGLVQKAPVSVYPSLQFAPARRKEKTWSALVPNGFHKDR